MRSFLIFISLALTGSAAWAAESPSPVSSGFLLQGIFGLLIVLGLMAGAFWIIKRFQSNRMVSGINMKVVGGMAIGSRERIMVVEIADQWLVIGVTPTQVNILTTLPRQCVPEPLDASGRPVNFSEYLKKTFKKNHGA